MIVEQHYLQCLSQASYLIADEKTKVAAVVDPRRDVELYLERSAELGVEIKHVFLTHFHADFLAGHLELRERTGATIHLGAKADAEFAFNPCSDGDAIELGDVRIEILETPGHTPESMSLVVKERAGAAPYAVLTGDTLFIGDVGRPDLMASVGVTAEELGSMLYDSLREKLMTLPDETLLYPGHGAGSACGKNMSKETVCTIGRQKESNYALQDMSKEAFVKIVAAGQPTTPAYFAYDATLNRKEHPTLDKALDGLVPLSLDEVTRRQNQGAQLLDVDSPPAFAKGHLQGSINVGLEGRFAGWAGSVLDQKAPIVIVGPAGSEREAATRLGRVGFDHVVGYLEGGKAQAPELVSTKRWIATTLRDALASGAPPKVLDVRTPGEREACAIDGSRHVPLVELPNRLSELEGEGPFVITCGGGYRSMIAASLLEKAGIAAEDLEGGMNAWQALES